MYCKVLKSCRKFLQAETVSHGVGNNKHQLVFRALLLLLPPTIVLLRVRARRFAEIWFKLSTKNSSISKNRHIGTSGFFDTVQSTGLEPGHICCAQIGMVTPTLTLANGGTTPEPPRKPSNMNGDEVERKNTLGYLCGNHRIIQHPEVEQRAEQGLGTGVPWTPCLEENDLVLIVSPLER
uniref:Uncharacterized protein n=1 Tax=Romanomermis culicivorax TaxID=13658 RepID=A0A915J3L4_ROMCU